MTKKTKVIIETVWYASVEHIDGQIDKFPVRVLSNTLQTKTGFMNGTLFTIKDAHYAAFGQAGFGVRQIILARRQIKYDVSTGKYEVL